MGYDDQYRISITPIENGFTVQVPDMEEIAKKQAAAKKAAGKSGGMAGPSVYIGDCTETYACKSIKEVMKVVQAAIEQLPEDTPDKQFDKAFSDAAK